MLNQWIITYKFVLLSSAHQTDLFTSNFWEDNIIACFSQIHSVPLPHPLKEKDAS